MKTPQHAGTNYRKLMARQDVKNLHWNNCFGDTVYRITIDGKKFLVGINHETKTAMPYRYDGQDIIVSRNCWSWDKIVWADQFLYDFLNGKSRTVFDYDPWFQSVCGWDRRRKKNGK